MNISTAICVTRRVFLALFFWDTTDFSLPFQENQVLNLLQVHCSKESLGKEEVPIQLRSATLLGVGHCVSETEDIGSRGTGWEARTGNPSLSQPRSGGACGPPGSRCACLHQFSSLLFGKNSCFYRLRTSRHPALTASLRLSANSRSHTQCVPAPVALHS